MQEVRQHQMEAAEASPEVTALMHALNSMESLDGRIIADHNHNKLRTISDLKQAYGRAINTSIQYQRDNYISEKERESDFAKLKELLDREGTAEQKSNMQTAETMWTKKEYTYYKKRLDDASIWCMTDKDLSQKKPLFFPKDFIIERLYQKYEAELSRTQKVYDPDVLSKRAKEIEKMSQKLKHKFNRDYLYNLRTGVH